MWIFILFWAFKKICMPGIIPLQYWSQLCIFLFAHHAYTYRGKKPDPTGKDKHWIVNSRAKIMNDVDLINTSVTSSSPVHSALKHKTQLKATTRQLANKQKGGLSFAQRWIEKFSQPQRGKKAIFKSWGWNVCRGQLEWSRYKGCFSTFSGRNMVFSYNLNYLFRDYATEWNFPHHVISKSGFDHCAKLRVKTWVAAVGNKLKDQTRGRLIYFNQSIILHTEERNFVPIWDILSKYKKAFKKLVAIC